MLKFEKMLEKRTKRKEIIMENFRAYIQPIHINIGYLSDIYFLKKDQTRTHSFQLYQDVYNRTIEGDYFILQERFN